MRRVYAAALAACLLLAVVGSASAEEGISPAAVETDARAYILLEQSTGQVLCGENVHEALEPASVTKVMTMLLVMEAVDSGQITMEDMVTTSEHAAEMGGSQIYLEPGETMSVRELLKSVAVVSGNDAAVALAEYVAGSEPAFVERMNQRAADLGMNDTTFCNCNGLPQDGHVTSAYDIAIMSRELMKHEGILEFTTIWMDSVRGGEFGLANTNKLIKTYSGITGLKTGYTDGAGYCLSATANRDGMGLVAVVLGASTSAIRFATASQLLDYGFANYALVSVRPEGALPPVTVTLGELDSVQPVADQSDLLVSRADAAGITTQVELTDSVAAPVEEGQELGALVVLLNGEEVDRIPLRADRAVARLTFGGVFRQLLRQMAVGEQN